MQAMQDGIDQGFSDRMLYVEYKRLVASPDKVLREIYDFLGRPFFTHSFSNIENTERENDIATYGMPDMHEVRKQISRADINPKNVLSQYVLDRCGKLDFWRL
jgi:sulfotransferase